MKRFFITLLVFGCFTNTAQAICFGPPLVDIPIISVDLSDKISEKNNSWTQYAHLDLPSAPTLNCSSYDNYFYYYPTTRTMGLNGGKHWIKVEVSGKGWSDPIPGGEHSPTILNKAITIKYTLVTSGSTEDIVQGSSVKINEAVIIADETGRGVLGNIISGVYKFASWAASFFRRWPYDERDMYRQSLLISYSPKTTTCTFNNAGLMVNLPKTGVAQLTKTPQPGYTPFTLNFSCNNLLANGSTDRAIDMFLSSNDLLPTDNSVLMSHSSGAAQGVGIKVTKRENPNAPVVFSTSTLNRGNATSIFSAAAGAVVENNFSIGMGAYYFPYNPAQLTSGEVRATATLNIVYQ